MLAKRTGKGFLGTLPSRDHPPARGGVEHSHASTVARQERNRQHGEQNGSPPALSGRKPPRRESDGTHAPRRCLLLSRKQQQAGRCGSNKHLFLRSEATEWVFRQVVYHVLSKAATAVLSGGRIGRIYLFRVHVRVHRFLDPSHGRGGQDAAHARPRRIRTDHRPVHDQGKRRRHKDSPIHQQRKSLRRTSCRPADALLDGPRRQAEGRLRRCENPFAGGLGPGHTAVDCLPLPVFFCARPPHVAAPLEAAPCRRLRRNPRVARRRHRRGRIAGLDDDHGVLRLVQTARKRAIAERQRDRGRSAGRSDSHGTRSRASTETTFLNY
mmetsp:Transcript_12119/g.25650  ORF Transcript_12119/g.25650 Transcript_12119/m.25650 type:complete len:325 (+) Transcript_12119:1222-2196(+)